MSLVTLDSVYLFRGNTEILQNINLTVEPGEIVTIVGPNGSGKSTLLQSITGALVPRSGTVSHAKGLKIGYVPQRLSIDPNLPISVARFLKLGQNLKNAGHDSEMIKQIGIGSLLNHPMTSLSGGQFQRVLLAKAIQNAPQILLLDEPTQGLDQPGTAAFYQLIAELRSSLGCAILMVSHDLHVVMSASDRVICLNGHICCQGTPSVVSATPEYRELFGEGTEGTFALYQHAHDHDHDHDHTGHDYDHA